MGRPGVTKSEVFNAANALVGKGKPPTIEQVRIELGGTGSNSTIAGYLREWRAQQDGTQILALNENLPQEFVSLMKGLWDRMRTEAQDKIDIAEDASYQIQNELKNQLQTLQTDYNRCQQVYEQTKTERDSLNLDKTALEQNLIEQQKSISVLTSKHDSLVNQLAEKQQYTEELHRLHKQAQDNLEHYRESAREQRMLEQHRYEQEKQELQLELKNIKDQIVLRDEKLSGLRQQIQSLEHTHEQLQKEYTQNLTQLEAKNAQINEIDKLKNEFEKQKDHWHQMYHEASIKVEKYAHQFIDYQAEIKVLTQQLEAAKKTLEDTLQENKLLGHERWLFAQEKAQLEGQLKQMQALLPT